MGHLDEQIRAMRERGLSVDTISRRLHVDAMTVAGHIAAAGNPDALREIVEGEVRRLLPRLLKQLAPTASPPRHARIATIINIVATLADLPPDALTGARRARHVSLPRHIAILLASEVCQQASLPTIGQHFGDRDHCTIMHSIKRARELVARDPAMAALYRAAKDRLLAGSEKDVIDG